MTALTRQQRFVLELLRRASPLSTKEIAKATKLKEDWIDGSPDRARSCLKRLAARGFVDQDAHPGFWYLTNDGERALLRVVDRERMPSLMAAKA